MNASSPQSWLSRTQMTVASEDIPTSLADAERLLNQHQQLRDEINTYAPEYAKIKDFGDKVTEGEDDPQYMFLRQVSVELQPLNLIIDSLDPPRHRL